MTFKTNPYLMQNKSNFQVSVVSWTKTCMLNQAFSCTMLPSDWLSAEYFHSPRTGVGTIWPNRSIRLSLWYLMAKIQLILSVDTSSWIITMGEKAQPVKLCPVMRGYRSHGVKFLSYPGRGRREIEEVKRNLIETLWSCVIFSLMWENLIWKLYLKKST